MAITPVFLTEVASSTWQLFSYKGSAISSTYYGSPVDARYWAQSWISGFNNWRLIITGEEMKKKAEFIERLFKLLNCKNDLLEFLKTEKVITVDVASEIIHSPHVSHAVKMTNLLESLAQQDKLQLVSYEWVILPNELLRLSIVTNNTKKDFTYTV